jgi:predicted amino acid racemase
MKKQLPKGINHFRVGEMLYFGNDLFTGGPVEELKQDVIKLYAEIIELSEKPKVPTGVLDANPSGEVYEINEDDYGKTSYRAIIDLGLLDISTDFLKADDPNIDISGASSDMIVMDIGENEQGYKVGDLVSFNIQYMGALALLNSDYIGKELI